MRDGNVDISDVHAQPQGKVRPAPGAARRNRSSSRICSMGAVAGASAGTATGPAARAAAAGRRATTQVIAGAAQNAFPVTIGEANATGVHSSQ